MADLKKKMDDLEKDRGKSSASEAAYLQARSAWQGAEENWRKIEQGEEIPKPAPKPKPKPKPKKKPEDNGSSTPPDDDGGGA